MWPISRRSPWTNSVPPKRCGRALTPGQAVNAAAMVTPAPRTGMDSPAQRAQLAQQGNAVALGPALHNFAVLKTKVVHRRPTGMFAGGGQAGIGALLCGRDRAAHMHQVAFGDHALDLELEIREGGQEQPYGFGNALGPTPCLRRAMIDK